MYSRYSNEFKQNPRDRKKKKPENTKTSKRIQKMINLRFSKNQINQNFERSEKSLIFENRP